MDPETDGEQAAAKHHAGEQEVLRPDFQAAGFFFGFGVPPQSDRVNIRAATRSKDTIRFTVGNFQSAWLFLL